MFSLLPQACPGRISRKRKRKLASEDCQGSQVLLTQGYEAEDRGLQMSWQGIEHVAIVVRNLEMTLPFYRDVLGFPVLFDKELDDPGVGAGQGLEEVRTRIVILEVPGGRTRLELLQYRSHIGEPLRLDNRPYDSGVRHVAFVVEALDQAYETLLARGVRFISPPTKLETPEARGTRFCYFRDPDGVLLELEESPTTR
jgi:glyoxylase I family protein